MQLSRMLGKNPHEKDEGPYSWWQYVNDVKGVNGAYANHSKCLLAVQNKDKPDPEALYAWAHLNTVTFGAAKMPPDEIFGFYRAAAELNHEEAIDFVNKYFKDINKFEYTKQKEAVQWWEKLAAMGNRYGRYKLANFYLYGFKDIVVKDVGKAEQLFRLAAEQGYVKARAMLLTFVDPETVPSQWYLEGNFYWAKKYEKQGNFPQAFKHYKLVADSMGPQTKPTKEQVQAQLKVGIYYHDGSGVTRDFEKAAEYFFMAPEKNIEALCYLCRSYELGDNVDQDIPKARDIYEKILALVKNDKIVRLVNGRLDYLRRVYYTETKAQPGQQTKKPQQSQNQNLTAPVPDAKAQPRFDLVPDAKAQPKFEPAPPPPKESKQKLNPNALDFVPKGEAQDSKASGPLMPPSHPPLFPIHGTPTQPVSIAPQTAPHPIPQPRQS